MDCRIDLHLVEDSSFAENELSFWDVIVEDGSHWARVAL